MNQLPGTFVPRQKMRNLLWKVKRSHWCVRVPLSTPHLVNAIVAEYHVVFFFFVEPSQAGSEMVLRDQRGRMIDVGIPAAAAQLVYTQCLFFPPRLFICRSTELRSTRRSSSYVHMVMLLNTHAAVCFTELLISFQLRYGTAGLLGMWDCEMSGCGKYQWCKKSLFFIWGLARIWHFACSVCDFEAELLHAAKKEIRDCVQSLCSEWHSEREREKKRSKISY